LAETDKSSNSCCAPSCKVQLQEVTMLDFCSKER